MFPLAWEDLGQSAQNCLFLWNVTPLASLGVLGKPFLFLCLADCSAGMEEEGQIIDFFFILWEHYDLAPVGVMKMALSFPGFMLTWDNSLLGFFSVKPIAFRSSSLRKPNFPQVVL